MHRICRGGSEHKLYSVDEDLKLTIHPESVGGTPAGRMIHRESNQLLIAHYLIDESGKVRVISPKVMPGRITAIARHLVDPANMVYYCDMEGMLYEAKRAHAGSEEAVPQAGSGLARQRAATRRKADWSGRTTASTRPARTTTWSWAVRRRTPTRLGRWPSGTGRIGRSSSGASIPT